MPAIVAHPVTRLHFERRSTTLPDPRLTMKVSEALESRLSCRAFLDRPVPQATLQTILDTAKRAPSGGNLQPWQVHVVTGASLAELIALVRDKQRTQPRGEGSEYPIYPEDLPEPYKSRRFQCGEDMYATIPIERTDKLGRLAQFKRNFEFFGAPVGLFFSIDRCMGVDQWADMGMFMQSIMLLAREHGLDTCAQEAWAVWYQTVGNYLGIPPAHMLFCGMALGFRDPAARINQLRTARAPLEEFVTWRGF
jgi:nitroreductase